MCYLCTTSLRYIIQGSSSCSHKISQGDYSFSENLLLKFFDLSLPFPSFPLSRFFPSLPLSHFFLWIQHKIHAWWNERSHSLLFFILYSVYLSTFWLISLLFFFQVSFHFRLLPNKHSCEAYFLIVILCFKVKYLSVLKLIWY